MPTQEIVLSGRQVRMTGPLGARKMFLMRAEIDEGLSRLTDTDVQFLSPDIDLDLAAIVGRQISLEIDLEDGSVRLWHGTCTECSYEGLYQGLGLYRAEVRPWFWFLTRTANCRVFQNMTTIEIAKQIFGDRGFSDFRDATREGLTARDYCVQYRETDYAFLCRLMEEEGIYWFFDHGPSRETLVLVDGKGAHAALPGAAEVEFNYRDHDYRRRKDHIFDWQRGERLRSGKVTLNDYNFLTPRSDLKGVTAIPVGTHERREYEVYDYPGDVATAAEAKRLSRLRQEAHVAQHQRARAAGNVRVLATGRRFTLTGHPREGEDGEYLITSARHVLQIDTDYDADKQAASRMTGTTAAEDEVKDTYLCEFEVQPLNTPYRCPPDTPRPSIAGIQTAVVTGPDGEEIYTDEHGRVKVQFHWDRLGASNETSSLWCRVAMPWTGQGWGMYAVPRIGQEVVVQFEEGNPDRPLITGMVYNAANMPPAAWPGHQTQLGIKTNSSLGGGGFHELMFEDKKDSELVRFQSEKDYVGTIKNNATVTIGREKCDPGDFTQTIYHDKTETLETGDHTFTVASGKETGSIKQDRAWTVEGADSLEVSRDKSDTIRQDYTITVGPNLTVTAESRIRLECGSTSIEMTPSGLRITSPQVEISASAQFKVQTGAAKVNADGALELKAGGMAKLEAGGMAQLKSGGIMMIKGGVVMVN